MTRFLRIAIVLLCAVFAFGEIAQANSVQIYTWRFLWQSAVSGMGTRTTIGFEGIAPNGGLVDYSSTGIDLAGVHFDSFSSHGDKYLLVVDSNFPNNSCGYPCYQWNTGAVLHGPPTTFDGQFGFPAGISATLPSNVYAVGVNLWTILPDQARINISVGGPGWGTGTFITGGDFPTEAFIGFVSDTPISDFRIFASSVPNPGPGGGPYSDLDNFTYVRIPEPAAWALTGAGLLLLALKFRK